MNRPIALVIILLFLSLSLYKASAEEILTWQDCVKEAAKNNPDLISAQENIKAQNAGKAIKASGLLPQISATASGSTAKTTTASSSSTSDTYSYGVSSTQLVFDGMQTINDVKAAGENVVVAKEGYRFASSDVRLSLRTAFVNLLKAQELITVAEDIVDIRRGSLELITLRYKSGLEHKGALLTAEANLSQALFELSQARRDVELAQRQLTKEMGREGFIPMRAQGDFVIVDAASEKPDFEELVKNNPSLLEAIAKQRSALLNIKSAYGDFAPQISANAGTSRKSSHWPPEDDQWNLGLSVSLPIFEGGLRLAQVSQAQALYNQAQESQRGIRDTAIVSLEQAWVDLQDSTETVGVRRKSLEAAEERSKIAEAQYSTGFISFDNWVIIQNDLVTSKKNYLQAQTNALLAEASWIQAKGETLEYAQ